MGRSLPDVLTREEQLKLLDQFNTRYVTPHRNKTFIKLALNTGMRLSELTNLTWNNIDLNIGRIKVVEGKGAKDRMLYIGDKTVGSLISWKERQFEEWGKSERVFTTRTLNQWDGKAVRKMIATYTERAGIDKHVTTHTFRHTFATDLLQKTNNLRVVQKTLGHSHITTTEIYTHISDGEVEEAMKNLRE